MVITAAQIRAARAMLRWSANKLAEASGVSLPTIQRMETGEGVPKSITRNVDAVQRALERAGILFIDEEDDGQGPGIRRKKPRKR
jgi:transcriptional regulator with XRE-family HTH domain